MEIAKMNYRYPGLVIRRGGSGSKDCDEDFRIAVLNGTLVVYIDEWSNHRTMEARAYGLIPGDKPVVIGYQLDGGQGIPPEQLWKSIDDLDRVMIGGKLARVVDRTIPAQHAGQLSHVFALAPQTGLDLSKHEADGY
jgi:hypothetical protein